MTTSIEAGVYVDALQAGKLFADPAYQRELEPKRVAKMAAEYDRRLVGVLEVSERADGRFAILDGQHRHAVVLAVSVAGAGTFVVCQVHTGLTVEAEAQLFHELNLRRKALGWWDRWRARRAGGDERVAAIEQVLARHQVQIHPSPNDGNVRATTTVETIVDSMGDLSMLDSVLTVVTSAFGRSFEGLNGTIMQAVAYVLGAYTPDELDIDRLVRAMAELPPRQIIARTAALREIHKGTSSRLCAEVLVQLYNRGRGPKVEAFLQRVPSTAIRARQRAAARNAAAHHLGTDAPAPVDVDEHLVDELVEVVHEPARSQIADASAAAAVAFMPDAGICRCTHAARRHDHGDGYCLIGDCDCSAFDAAVSA